MSTLGWSIASWQFLVFMAARPRSLSRLAVSCRIEILHFELVAKTRVTLDQGHFEVGRYSSCVVGISMPHGALPSAAASAEYACDSKVLRRRVFIHC